MAGATTCPECGARVSAYAAGCEKCGADLEAYHRRLRVAEAEAAERRASRRIPRPDLRAIPLTRYEAAYLVLTVAVLLWVSFLAIILGALGVLHGYYEQRPGWMAVCGAITAVALGLELVKL